MLHDVVQKNKVVLRRQLAYIPETADLEPGRFAEDCRAIIEMIASVFESHRVGGPIELPMVTRVNPLTLLS